MAVGFQGVVAAGRTRAPLAAAFAPVRRAWRRFLALTHLSSAAVCEQSAGLGPHDYHDYRDDADGVPWCTEGGARCARCGKRYRL